MADSPLVANAKAKYDLLVTGMAPRVAVDGLDGSRIEYQGANAAALLAYIRTFDPTYLVEADPTAKINGPIRFFI